MYRSLAGAVLALSIVLPARAEEGKWTPEQVLRLDAGWLKRQGLQLPPSRLWDAKRGEGLLSAVVNTGGCSASFVSPAGLIITNHHCLFAILQEHSTPSNDIITNGFLAATRAAELPSKTTRVTIPVAFTDVTEEVRRAISTNASDIGRQREIEVKQNELVAGCEKKAFHRCRVAAFDGGVQYVLVDTLELQDVRLVYAPPRAIGEYGGEIDNWSWPRHTGDFAIARAYVAADGTPAPYDRANVPFQPKTYLPVSREGVTANSFVMVMGYPGTTYRSLTAAEMDLRRDLTFRARKDVYGEWIGILEKTTEHDAAGRIAVAAMLKSLLNTHKNAEGQLAGFARGHIVEKQKAAEDEVVAWVKARPTLRPALEAFDGLNDLVKEQRASGMHDFLLSSMAAGSRALYLATTLVRASEERQKPDAERDPAYMDRERPRLRDRLEREQANYFEPADKALFASFLRRAAALPEEQRIAGIAGVLEKIDAIYAGTRVMDVQQRLAMFEETPEQLRARHDSLLDLGFQLQPELLALKERNDRWSGAIARLRPQWRAAVQQQAGRPIAPDANSTLRISFAHVQGYSPRDGVYYTAQTTLAGVVEKHTGEEPFAVPAPILKAAKEGRLGQWKDAALKDVPVNFLADADTTGGNSGSPVVNGKGELVGLNFDRVWENVANDFGYNPAVARNISVDIRYLLWLLDEVYDAHGLLEELHPQ